MPRNRAEWFGPRLKEMREAAGLTQAELGKRAGVVGSQINKLELGINQPTLATAVALARGLGVEVGAFVDSGLQSPAEEPVKPRGRPRKDAPATKTEPANKTTTKRKG